VPRSVPAQGQGKIAAIYRGAPLALRLSTRPLIRGADRFKEGKTKSALLEGGTAFKRRQLWLRVSERCDSGLNRRASFSNRFLGESEKRELYAK